MTLADARMVRPVLMVLSGFNIPNSHVETTIRRHSYRNTSTIGRKDTLWVESPHTTGVFEAETAACGSAPDLESIAAQRRYIPVIWRAENGMNPVPLVFWLSVIGTTIGMPDLNCVVGQR
jgi:hypothetical protein